MSVVTLYIAIALTSLAGFFYLCTGTKRARRLLVNRAAYWQERRRRTVAEARVAELEATMRRDLNLAESRWAMRQEDLQDRGGRLAGMLTRERMLRVDAEQRCRVLERRLQAAECAWPELQRAALNRGLEATRPEHDRGVPASDTLTAAVLQGVGHAR